MGEIAKIDKDLASICKGEDKNNDAMMLMSPESNWDQFLTPAPFAIALLGELILISSDTDFSLEEKPPRDGFKHLRYPNSFRASLVQVSNEGWSAFNEAHTNDDSGERDEAYYDRELSIQRVYTQVSVITENVESIVEIDAGEFDDHGNECPDLTSVLNGSLDFLNFIRQLSSKYKRRGKSGKPGTRALKICNEGIMICTDLKAAAKSIQSENPQKSDQESYKSP
ncbi:unnamed protein product [Mytilus edulis]|uniref:Uncharacterized protein n=1 Tax=Mytilus edulis TaxID=6550 RepID=A0A8S3TMX1_MYTED|nr:unnamed protein product [Mytilus edulis]